MTEFEERLDEIESEMVRLDRIRRDLDKQTTKLNKEAIAIFEEIDDNDEPYFDWQAGLVEQIQRDIAIGNELHKLLESMKPGKGGTPEEEGQEGGESSLSTSPGSEETRLGHPLIEMLVPLAMELQAKETEDGSN